MKNAKIVFRTLLLSALLCFSAFTIVNAQNDTSATRKGLYPNQQPPSLKPVPGILDTAHLKPNPDSTHLMPPKNPKNVPPGKQMPPQQTPPAIPPPNRKL